MIAETTIPIRKSLTSKLAEISLEQVPFGKYFTDHMLEADYVDGGWKNVEIKPFQPLVISPSLSAIHYGQSIFEGIKAYRSESGQALIFRPYDNFARFNHSAARMCMPAVPEEIFIDGMRELVKLDQQWISARPDHSLYIRPFMFSTDEQIGVKAADSYKFMIILSPTGPYYSKPLRIYAEEHYTRAARGGVGYAKAAGNYAASLLPAAEARQKGYDQVLWLDASEHKYIQEIGTMNVFFVLDGEIITPDLEGGTILAGVTRDSAITLLRDMGYSVTERPVHIDELLQSYRDGKLTEMFGTGTAATISPIRELAYQDSRMEFDTEKHAVAREMKDKLDAIRLGKDADDYNWVLPV